LSYTRAGGQQSDAGNQAVGLSDDRPLLLVPGMVGEVVVPFTPPVKHLRRGEGEMVSLGDKGCFSTLPSPSRN